MKPPIRRPLDHDVTRLEVTTSVPDERSLPDAWFGMCAGIPPEDTTYDLPRQRLRTPNHCDFRLPFGMESHSLSAFPLPSAMEPDSQADFSFHSRWKPHTEPDSSFHLKWKPIPELLPVFHSQWIANSERCTPFHSQWIPHCALPVRSIHDGSRFLLPPPALPH